MHDLHTRIALKLVWGCADAYVCVVHCLSELALARCGTCTSNSMPICMGEHLTPPVVCQTVFEAHADVLPERGSCTHRTDSTSDGRWLTWLVVYLMWIGRMDTLVDGSDGRWEWFCVHAWGIWGRVRERNAVSDNGSHRKDP